MGMLAMMNALALQDALRRAGVESRVQSALRIFSRRPYIRGRALCHLEAPGRHLRGRHGQSVLHHGHRRRAARAMGVDIVLKATKVDGVCGSRRDPTATRYATLTFDKRSSGI
jgi:uridylate kinase